MWWFNLLSFFSLFLVQGLHSASIPGILALDLCPSDTNKVLTGTNTHTHHLACLVHRISQIFGVCTKDGEFLAWTRVAVMVTFETRLDWK